MENAIMSWGYRGCSSKNPFHSLPVNVKKPVPQSLIQKAPLYHILNSRFNVIQARQGIVDLLFIKSEML